MKEERDHYERKLEGLIGKERSGVLNFLVASPQVCNAKMI